MGLRDIVYAVDITATTEVLEQVNKFLIESVKPQNVEKGNVRIGLVKYDAKPSRLMDFSDSNEATMELLLDHLSSSKGESAPVKALTFIQESYYSSGKSREDAAKSVVMFINGDREQDELNKLESTLKSYHALGVKYILISVGGSSAFQQAISKIKEPFGTVKALDSGSQLPVAIPNVIETGKGKFLLILLQYYR